MGRLPILRFPSRVTATIMQFIEDSEKLTLDFGKLSKIADAGQNVVPAIIQCTESLEVLMMGYMNEATFKETLEKGVVVFWSTSRNERWEKGLTSGNRLLVKECLINCEQNSLLIKTRLEKGGACHTLEKSGLHRQSCYYRKITDEFRLKFT